MKKLSKKQKIITFTFSFILTVFIFLFIKSEWQSIRRTLCMKEITCYGYEIKEGVGCHATSTGECIEPEYKRVNRSCDKTKVGLCL